MRSESVDDSGSATSRALWRYNAFVFSYWMILTAVMVTLTLTIDFFVGTLLTILGHLLVQVRAFAIRSEEVMVTEKAPSMVSEELSSARNPFTALWIERSDSPPVQIDPDDDRVEVTKTGLLGLTRRRYAIAVDEQSAADIRMEIQRDDSVIATAEVSLEGVDGGTSVSVTTDRTSVNGFDLLLMLAVDSGIARHLTAHGYELVDTESSVRFRTPFD